MPAETGKAQIVMREDRQAFRYGGTVVLTMTLRWPQVILRGRPGAQSAVNRRIGAQTAAFRAYAGGELYQRAVQNFRDSVSGEFPFHPYDAVLQYEVTLNACFRLSMFRDRYEYTGGAHGNTLRASDTWDTATGRALPLSSLFRPGTGWRIILFSQMLQQADEQAAQNPGVFFEDYRTLMRQYFNPRSYFLTPDGVSVYYQQYEIAPYSSGIVVFNIPYGDLPLYRPPCPDSVLERAADESTAAP